MDARPPSRTARAATLTLGVALLVAACGASAKPSESAASGGHTINVVAAESFWGSIASQLGDEQVKVTSIISNPDTDPHDYEPTPQDGRSLAGANYVVFNGLGYDAWAGQAIDANPAPDRKVLEIGSRLNLHEGDNPHRWYFPDDVERVIDQITADYKTLDPADAAYFDQQHETFETKVLERYKDALAEIKRKYAGTPVGASESIFVGVAEATGLNLLTPSGFLTAISEGTDPTAQDKATADGQITGKQIGVFVFNSQNATPDVQTLVDAARANGIEVATVTETPPENVAFQDWQADQLQQLVTALARATGR